MPRDIRHTPYAICDIPSRHQTPIDNITSSRDDGGAIRHHDETHVYEEPQRATIIFSMFDARRTLRRHYICLLRFSVTTT